MENKYYSIYAYGETEIQIILVIVILTEAVSELVQNPDHVHLI